MTVHDKIVSVGLVRKYRNYKETKAIENDSEQPVRDDNEYSGDSDEEEEEENDEDNNRRKQAYRKPWKESTLAAPVINTDIKIGKIIDRYNFILQVDSLR